MVDTNEKNEKKLTWLLKKLEGDVEQLKDECGCPSAYHNTVLFFVSKAQLRLINITKLLRHLGYEYKRKYYDKEKP